MGTGGGVIDEEVPHQRGHVRHSQRIDCVQVSVRERGGGRDCKYMGKRTGVTGKRREGATRGREGEREGRRGEDGYTRAV